MVDRAEQFGRAPELGDQYPEQRGTFRVLVHDPEAQARGARFLYGLYAAFDGVQSGIENPNEVRAALRVVMEAYRTRFPEFLETSHKMSSDMGGGTYHAEERLMWLIGDMLGPKSE